MSTLTQMPKIRFISIATYYYILLHTSKSLSQVCLPESWITKCGSKLIYETLPGKEVLYVLPIASILGRLPVVRNADSSRVLCEFLGAGLVQRLLKCNKGLRVTVGNLLKHYYTLYYINIFALLRIITLSIFTLIIHHYYAL